MKIYIVEDDRVLRAHSDKGREVPLDDNGVDPVLETDKILGVETHSLCKMDSWKKAVFCSQKKKF